MTHLDDVHQFHDASSASAASRETEFPADDALKAPTDADEPPWPGWFSCEDCNGWFYGNGVAYESGEVVCDSCASVREEPSVEAVTAELACAWFCTSTPTIPETGYAGDIVRAVRAATVRARRTK